eukprot:m.279076 g.279076  ORF g.279076 m.279076 type:complete len:185 (+) comp16156_c0_seq4:770-1324(+)
MKPSWLAPFLANAVSWIIWGTRGAAEPYLGELAKLRPSVIKLARGTYCMSDKKAFTDLAYEPIYTTDEGIAICGEHHRRTTAARDAAKNAQWHRPHFPSLIQIPGPTTVSLNDLHRVVQSPISPIGRSPNAPPLRTPTLPRCTPHSDSRHLEESVNSRIESQLCLGYLQVTGESGVAGGKGEKR